MHQSRHGVRSLKEVQQSLTGITIIILSRLLLVALASGCTSVAWHKILGEVALAVPAISIGTSTPRAAPSSGHELESVKGAWITKPQLRLKCQSLHCPVCSSDMGERQHDSKQYCPKGCTYPSMGLPAIMACSTLYHHTLVPGRVHEASCFATSLSSCSPNQTDIANSQA